MLQMLQMNSLVGLRHTLTYLTILFPAESAKSERLNAVVLGLATVLDGIVESLAVL